MAAAARAAQVQPAISCAAPLSVGDLVAEAARAAQVQPAIGELTPLAQPFAAPVTGDALMERAGHLATHPMQAASAHTSEFQLPAAQLATCCAPVEGRATMDYDAIELADDGLRKQFGYLRLQCGRRLCKQSQEHAGHTHYRFSSYIYSFQRRIKRGLGSGTLSAETATIPETLCPPDEGRAAPEGRQPPTTRGRQPGGCDPGQRVSGIVALGSCFGRECPGSQPGPRPVGRESQGS